MATTKTMSNTIVIKQKETKTKITLLQDIDEEACATFTRAKPDDKVFFKLDGE